MATKKCSITIMVIITVSLTNSTRRFLTALGPICAIGIQSTLIDIRFTFLIHTVNVIVAGRSATVKSSWTIFTVVSTTNKLSCTFRIIITASLSIVARDNLAAIALITADY